LIEPKVFEKLSEEENEELTKRFSTPASRLCENDPGKSMAGNLLRLSN